MPSTPVECLIDPDCRDDQICHNFNCLDPCLVDNPCAINAICSARTHAAQCRCPEGLNGDPYVLCKRDECRVNRDCARDKACRQGHCVDPCTDASAGAPCAPAAECHVADHNAKCVCPPGTIGNPVRHIAPFPFSRLI